MVPHSRAAILLLVASLVAASFVGSNADSDTCTETEEEMAVGLLQVKTSKAKGPSFAVPQNGKSDSHALTDGEWNATHTDLLQLKELAVLYTSNGTLDSAAHAELVPMLEMLRGLYNSTKQQISELTNREQTSKQRFEEKKATHEARLASLDARFQNHSLSEEFHADELKEENRMWSYWQRVRGHEHKQFQSFLRIKHTMMHKMKRMIEVYEEVIAGKADAAKIQEDIAKVTGQSGGPLVFLQEDSARTTVGHLWQEIKAFCHEALDEVHAARRDLSAHWGQGHATSSSLHH